MYLVDSIMIQVCIFALVYQSICMMYVYLYRIYIHWIGQHIGHQGTPDTSTELRLSKAGTSNIDGLRDGRS